MGLDYSMENIQNHHKRQQRTVCRKKLPLAVKLNKTVVIHSFKVGNNGFHTAKEELPTGTKIHVQGWLDLLLWIPRFLFAFIDVTPVCTYKNVKSVAEVVRCAPLELHRLVLEIDAPHFLLSCSPSSSKTSDP